MRDHIEGPRSNAADDRGTIALARASPSLVVATTAAKPTVSFTHLPPGVVTLVVDPPARFDDRPIELRTPRIASQVYVLGAGQNLVLDTRYEFVPSAGTVVVQVVNHLDDRVRLENIPVRLTLIGNGLEGSPPPVLTNGDGIATFTGVGACTYSVSLAVDPVPVGGRTWTANAAAPAVVVNADDSRGTVELRLVEDRHLMRGTVYASKGSTAAHALIEIRTAPDDDSPFDPTGRPVRVGGTVRGHVLFLTTVHQDGHLRRLVPVSVNSVARLDLFTDGSDSDSGGGSGGGTGGTTAEQDPTPFPLLVGNVDLTAETAPTGRSGGGDGGFG